MKRATLILSALLAFGVMAWSARQAVAPAPASLSVFMPHGAILFIEARDFSSLLQEWNASAVKQDWLKSENYGVFSKSRLFLRLQEAQQQFAAAAGIPPDMKFVAQAAGKQSALGLYDIGNLEFLYVSRVAASDATQSALWQGRGKFQTRSAGGITFYVRTDPESHRVVAFASTNDYLLLATREDLMAGALASLAGGKEPGIGDERWFQSALAAAGQPGELRMFLNLEKIIASPHYRSYWIQRNTGQMRAFSAAVCDLHREGSTFREERVLLRREQAEAKDAAAASVPAITPEGQQAVARLLSLVPPDAGVYRAVANPVAEEALSLVWGKLLGSNLSSAPESKLAPSVQLTGGVVGSSGDLETRIDVPPVVVVNTTDRLAALRGLVEKAGVLAALQVQSTRRDPDTSLVQIRSAIILAAANPWDAEAARQALRTSLAEITTQDLGLGWRRGGKDSGEYYELDGQFPLRLAIRGKYLVLSNDAAFLNSILMKKVEERPGAQAGYAAGFSHRLEMDNFAGLTRDLDSTGTADGQWSSGSPLEPAFFSGNLASLSHVLAGVKSESLITREANGKVLQTVVYHRDE
jgi:hypothetical protein